MAHYSLLNTQKLTGVVLCGGKSSRMGTDKGLIKKGNFTWAEIAFKKLASLSIPVVVSVNDSQVLEYKKIFSEIILVSDQVDSAGPLKGILSAHKKFPDNDLFILACDMVDVNFQLLDEIKTTYYTESGNYDFFVYRKDNFFEPLFGIYKSEALSVILNEINNGHITTYGINEILKKGNTFSLSIPQKFRSNFSNYNTPDFS